MLGGVNFLPESVVKVLLWPYVGLCTLFYNVSFVYRGAEGYLCSTGTFLITRVCLGNVFMAMVFVLLFFRLREHFRSYISQARWLGICLVLAIGIGYMTSSMRILASVPFTSSRYFGLIHGTIGIVLYLGGLIAINGAGEWILRKRG